MVLRLSEKTAIVAQLHDVAQQSVAAIATEYRGLTVAQLTTLRQQANELGIHIRIYRNTLARRAVQGTKFECMQDILVGPLVLLFSQDEPGAAARIVRDFAKIHNALIVKALVVEGKLLAAEQLTAVASLPTRDEALALLMSVMLAPVTKLVRTMAEPYAQAVRVIAAIGDKKQQTT